MMFVNNLTGVKPVIFTGYTLCGNWHFVCFGALPTVSECNATVVNPNPRSVTICQVLTTTTIKTDDAITILCGKNCYVEKNNGVILCSD